LNPCYVSKPTDAVYMPACLFHFFPLHFKMTSRFRGDMGEKPPCPEARQESDFFLINSNIFTRLTLSILHFMILNILGLPNLEICIRINICRKPGEIGVTVCNEKYANSIWHVDEFLNGRNNEAHSVNGSFC